MRWSRTAASAFYATECGGALCLLAQRVLDNQLDVPCVFDSGRDYSKVRWAQARRRP